MDVNSDIFKNVTSEDSVEHQEIQLLAEIENQIEETSRIGGKPVRGALLSWLRSKVDDPSRENSIVELICLLEKIGSNRQVVPVLLRSIDGGLLPEIETNNELSRAVANICERYFSELIAFLRIDIKAQNYKKVERLKDAHREVCEILEPLKQGAPSIVELMAARKSIMGALNHGILQKYGEPYEIKQIKSSVENCFHKLKCVFDSGVNFLEDVDAARSAINAASKFSSENGTFLAKFYLSPLISNFSIVLDDFLKKSKQRFGTKVEPRFNGALKKRYPLHEIERELQISVPLKNMGPGLLTSLKVTTSLESESVLLNNKIIIMGNVPPGNFSVILDVLTIEPAARLSATILLEWGEIGESAVKSEILEFDIEGQRSDIEWSAYEYWNPYTTEPVEGADFIGRLDKVKSLAAKLLRIPMESFYITGQKRVGKTSLAHACIEFAKTHAQGAYYEPSFNLWGSFAHEDPKSSLEKLGKSIEDLLKDSVPAIRELPPLDLNGSLAGLTRLFDMAFRLNEKKRFVVVIDEFDEIHQELYLYGNLAETFFANLRALSRCKNLCIILIGGENMPYVMERQGQKLNNFSRISLNYYDRGREWSDFQSLVQDPSSDVVIWHEDAIGEVFNSSNGNPYFAKLLCSAALENAIIARDADIGLDEVRFAGDYKVPLLGSNSFSHLWQDGIPKPISEREPEYLLRSRTLVALARCINKGMETNQANIYDCRAASLSEAELSAVLKDLVRREVLSETKGTYDMVLPMFRKWLIDTGAHQLAADSLTAELATISVMEELAATVRSDEIANLVRSWPTYRGKHIGTDDVRAWLQQVESQKDQRLLFELLRNVRIVSESRVREMLKSSFSFLQPLPPFVIRRKSDRRKNVVVTYVDGEGKSGASYASIFAEENLISSDCIFPPGEFDRRFTKHLLTEQVDCVVIIDDFVGTGKSMLKNLGDFLGKNEACIPVDVPVRIISLFATSEGQGRILGGLQKMSRANIDFRPCEVAGEDLFAFTESNGIWGGKEEKERAFALCNDLGKRIYKNNSLGYGGAGILLVFPTNTPNNSLPILHTASRSGNAEWKPLFPRVTH
ncbi:AAA family ATPase [Xanthomonas sacchari]